MSKINVSVDCVIFGFDDTEKKLKVLTIEKKVNPFSKQDHKKTQFAIPGDLIELDEDIDDAANRILFSLTKLDNLYLKQFKTFGNPTRVQEEKDKEWLENFRADPNERGNYNWIRFYCKNGRLQSLGLLFCARDAVGQI